MSGEKAKMLDGELYDPADPELAGERDRARELTAQYNRTESGDDDRRRDLLTELLGSIGTDSHIEPPFRCDYGDQIHVGENFFANFDCVVLDVCRVDIGRNCKFGPGVHVYTATHPLDPDERAEGLEYGKPVTVGDDVWVGGSAVINPGVSLGDGAVVASGAVVTEDVPDGVLVQGNPATVVRDVGTDQ